MRTGVVAFSSAYVQSAGLTLLSGGGLACSFPLQIVGGRLAGAGSISGTVSNNGTVTPGASAGLLTVSGNYTQTTNGVLCIELGGLAPGTNFDRLSVGGTASLTGTVSVALTNGFSPPANSAFAFVTCGSRSGGFSRLLYPSNDVGLSLQYATTSASVRTVNTRPVVLDIGELTVDELTPLNFTAGVTDDDVPSQTMTYALTNAPAGASIDPVTGQFTWTPTEAQGPTNASITIVATDDGTPPLSGSNTFQVVVYEVNQPPALALPPDQAVHATATLALHATATDPDIPTNTLTFALVVGPGGLTVDPAGLITWTPGLGQIGTTNTVTVRVFDNGDPVLEDVKSFAVSVRSQPVLTRIAHVGAAAEFTWTAISGTIYRAQFSPDLTLTNWDDLAGDVTAAGDTASKSDSAAASPRFYRIILAP
jgi:hypothetical protein